MSSGYISVKIPKALADSLKKDCKNEGFEDLSSYITYILRKHSNKDNNSFKKNGLTMAEKKKIESGLRSLGYL